MLTRPQHDQRVEDALYVKVRHHMAPEPILFVPLVLLPAQELWGGMYVNHVAPTDSPSDEDGDRPMADLTEPSDAPAVGTSSSSA